MQISLTAPRIEGTGPLTSKVAIVLESPSSEEMRSGLGLAGEQGRLFNRLLKHSNLTRKDVYITHLVKQSLPYNDWTRLGEVGLDREEIKEDLEIELSKLKDLEIVIPLGNQGLKALTGRWGITKWRGSVLKCPTLPKIKVIPTLHPSYVMKGQYKETSLMMFDFNKVGKALKNELDIVERTFKINPTFEECCELLDRFNKAPVVALDIETDMGANFIKCVGFADSRDFAGCIPFYEGGRAVWTEEQESFLWQRVRDILTNPQVGKVVQNMMFEMSVLYPWVGEINPVLMDTAIAHHCLLSELKKNLGLQTSIYTTEPYFKDEAKDGGWGPQVLYEYNCKDCTVTYEIYQVLEKDLKEEGMYDYFHGYQMPLATLLFRASNFGMKVNIKKVQQYFNKHTQLLNKAQRSLDKEVGYELNANSPKALAKLLYEEMGLPKQFNKITGKSTTNEEALVKLNKAYPNKIFDLILEVRGQRKLISTYLKEFWDEDERCRPNWNVYGTETGRLASSENIYGTGLNMQNIPGSIRDIFVADSGCILVKVDLSQVEARLVAYIAEDPTMMNVFEKGEDIHSKVASMVLDIPLERIGKDSEERKKGKTCVHAANYLIGAGKFGTIIGLPMARAKVLLGRYYSLFRLGSWHDKIKAKIKKDRILVTPFGRVRRFFDILGEPLYRSAIAHVPQSTASDHINRGAVRMEGQLPKGAQILLQVHDELVIQCLVKDKDRVIELIKRELSEPIPINGREVVIPVDIGVGYDWKSAGK